VITSGPDGNLWFTEGNANKIAKATPSGSITEFPIQTRNAGLTGITTGPDGKIWFTEMNANLIGQINPDGSNVMEFRIPTQNSGPGQIITGPDGKLWFTEYNRDQLGQLDPATGRVTEFPLPTGRPVALTVGPDSNLWFTDSAFNRIGRMTLGGKVTEFPVPTPGAGVEGITTGPDGNLWFTEPSASQIGRLNPANGSVQEFPTYTHNSTPWAITTGEDGNLWFTESALAVNQIARITPDGRVDEFAIPTMNSNPQSITSGPDCNIWFAENFKSNIGRYYLDLPATHFQVGTADSSTAGASMDVTVTALDKCDRTVFDYTGTVHFISSDSQATLPGDYTFTANDSGVHTFSSAGTLFTAGGQAITATDIVVGITGSVTVTVNPAPADHFVVTAPDTVMAGIGFDVTVTAQDHYGNTDTHYLGTVSLTSSDTDLEVMLPADYTFTGDDMGIHTFSSGVALFTPGDQTLTATDKAMGITGGATVTVMAPLAPKANFPAASGTLSAQALSLQSLTPGQLAATVFSEAEFQQNIRGWVLHRSHAPAAWSVLCQGEREERVSLDVAE
jgi:virginiamycin B lyase